MRFLYGVYVLLIALPILLIATILTATITIIGSILGSPKFWGYIPGKYWSKIICTLLLIPVEVKRRELLDRNKSYVFVSNHQGIFDIFLIYGYLHRNFKWMMKKSLRNIPFVGKACEKAGHIFVDRSGPQKVKQTITQARSTLQNGVSVVIFPEGARTFTGHMGYFKRGAFQLANDLELDVVPLTINGSFDICARTDTWIKRRRLTLTIHKPIPYTEKGAKAIKSTLDEAYKTVESGLIDKYKGMVVNEDQDVID